MTKQTKRQRKFQATGGVKGRIDKGTISKGGKLRRRRVKADHDTAPKASIRKRSDTVDRSDDLTGEQNLGDLDMDSFFAKFSDDQPENEVADEGSNDSSESDKSSSEDEVAAKNAPAESDSESDDDDVEVAEAQMKAEMAKMRQSDPEFHDFLSSNESALLDFGEDKGRRQDENEEKSKEDDKASNDQSGIVLTPRVLATLARGTFKSHGVKSLKKLIGAYKSACHLADVDETKHRPGESGQRYIIENSKVFDELMVLCLNRGHKEFSHHLLKPSAEEMKGNGEKSEKPINPKALENSERWVDMRPILESFFRSTLHVMSESKEPELLAFVLKALSKFIPFLTPFPRIAESMLKTLTELWSAPLDASESYQIVRLSAFLRIRQLALTQPFPFIEAVLKKTYLAYAKRAKFGSSVTNSPILPTLTFMGNCLVELYSLDVHSSYQHAFVYIRQLALLLRASMQKNTLDAIQQVYCWQFIQCLKLWVAVLSSIASADDGAMVRSLIYPLTEIIAGTARFAPSPVRHMPLRFQCVRLLQQLASSSECFIPTTSLLLDCLDWKEWGLPVKKTNRAPRGLTMQLMLKLGKEDALRTHEQLEAGISELFVLLQREIELYRYSAGFPEFAVQITVRLRLFNKQTRNSRWRAYAKGCLQLCSKYSAKAIEDRAKLLEAPKDVKRLECLRPASVPTMQERHDAAIEKERKALEASRPATTAEKRSRDQGDNESDNDSSQEKPPRKKGAAQEKKKPIDREILQKQMIGEDELMEEQDDLQEGIDWSDED